MKPSTLQLLFAVFLLSQFPNGIRAQLIDYGMLGAEVQSPAGVPLPLGSGGFQLFIGNNVNNLVAIPDSFTSINIAPGKFAKSVPLAVLTPTGSQIYLRASTSSVFDISSPWVLMTSPDPSWLTPNPSDPFAGSVIELSSPLPTIVATGSGGGYFDPAGNLVLVPEPSTYALLLMTGAGALWWARRKQWSNALPQLHRHVSTNERSE